MLNNCLKVQYIGLAIKTDQYNEDFEVVMKRFMSLLAQ